MKEKNLEKKQKNVEPKIENSPTESDNTINNINCPLNHESGNCDCVCGLEDQGSKETKKTNSETHYNSEIQELTELLQRVQANFENYRKQSEKRFEEFQQFAVKQIIIQLLEIIDNFELALKNSKNSSKEDFIKGIDLVYSQIKNILESHGLKQIQAEKFDPYLHEALMKEKSDKPENNILEEFQKGYILNGKVIRHAKVKLSSLN